MKTLNKLLSVLCIMALLISAVPAVQAQTTAPTLYFTNPTLTIGGSQVYCYLQMSNAENISAMDYIVTYDADNIELVSVKNSGFTSQSDVTVSANTSEPGVIHVTLVSQNGLNGSKYLNLMYFKAKADAKPGVYPISVLVNDMFNSSLETVEAVTQSGKITVAEASSTVKRVSFSNSVSKASLTVGESVNYKLSASSLNNLSAGSFEFTYDETKLKLNDVTLSSAMQNTVYDINDSIDGFVKMSFASEKAITSGSNMVTLNFSAIGAGTAEVSFKPSDLYDYEFAVMSGNTLSKSVVIAEPEIVVDYPDFKIVPPENIPSDKEFSVQVKLEGGSGVRAGDFVVNYNNSVLDCVKLTAETVSGAWLTTDKNIANGQVRFSIMSNVDIAEDTVLATLTMKSKENIDSKSNISVSGTGVYDVNFNVVTLEYIGTEIKAIRPEYTVNFYDSDGETMILTQKVMSGNSAIAPDVVQIKKNDNTNHLTFSEWDKDYSIITDDTDCVAVYTEESHTVITQSAVEATCTETGMTEGKYCVVCDTILVASEVVPANGHASVDTPAVEPGYDTYGSAGGTHCSVCGIVLTEPEAVEPTGPIVSAALDNNKKLTVTGGVSDNKTAECATYLAIYNRDKRLLCLKNITELDQSGFSISIENMQDAHTVKVLRWTMPALRPLHNAVEIGVEK
ncbi:MAG: hypothetical protein IJ300_10735 [Clostridia bacterium]|nr:hypothetical protein [Clostridia bacterium]